MAGLVIRGVSTILCMYIHMCIHMDVYTYIHTCIHILKVLACIEDDKSKFLENLLIKTIQPTIKTQCKTYHNPLLDSNAYIYLDNLIKINLELNYLLFIVNTSTIFLLFHILCFEQLVFMKNQQTIRRKKSFEVQKLNQKNIPQRVSPKKKSSPKLSNCILDHHIISSEAIQQIRMKSSSICKINQSDHQTIY